MLQDIFWGEHLWQGKGWPICENLWKSEWIKLPTGQKGKKRQKGKGANCQALSCSDNYKLFKCTNKHRLEDEGPWLPASLIIRIDCKSNWIMIITMRWPAAMRGTSSRNKTEIFWILLKCLFPIKGEASLYSRDESQTWGWTMDQDLGEVKHNDGWNFQDVDNVHQIVPNQSEFGLESVSCKSFFLFPNQTGIGL